VLEEEQPSCEAYFREIGEGETAPLVLPLRKRAPLAD
jgi:hypothetical protein